MNDLGNDFFGYEKATYFAVYIIKSRMGSVSFSIPKEVVLQFVSTLKIPNFVETGTFKGDTALWAAGEFEKVYTIEIDPGLSLEASKRPNPKNNVEFIVGDSKTELPKLVKKLEGAALFWLDGHWCMGGGGKDAECPLMDELQAISNLKSSIVMIDDARCFLGPLPPPHNSKDWPRIDEIFHFFQTHLPEHTTTLLDDVILSFPKEATEAFEGYWKNSYQTRFNDPNFTLKRYPKSTLIKNIFK